VKPIGILVLVSTLSMAQLAPLVAINTVEFKDETVFTQNEKDIIRDMIVGMSIRSGVKVKWAVASRPCKNEVKCLSTFALENRATFAAGTVVSINAQRSISIESRLAANDEAVKTSAVSFVWQTEDFRELLSANAKEIVSALFPSEMKVAPAKTSCKHIDEWKEGALNQLRILGIGVSMTSNTSQWEKYEPIEKLIRTQISKVTNEKQCLVAQSDFKRHTLKFGL
jgi:hypothetical protein